MFTWFTRKKILYKGEKKTFPYFYLEDIQKYYELKKERNEGFFLSDQTCEDLTFNELFMFLDRTVSAPGQQYLYNQLRSVQGKENPVHKYEDLIKTFQQQSGLQEKVTQALSPLSSPDAYGIISLLRRPYEIPSGLISFRVLGVVGPLLLATAIVTSSGWAWLGFLFALILNLVLHYRNKPNTWGFLSSIPQLIKLLKVTEELHQIPGLRELEQEIPESIEAIKPVRQHRYILMGGSGMLHDVAFLATLIREFIHILFLTEPITYIRFIRLLKSRKEHIETLFRFVGLADTLLSIAWLRNDLPYYTIPATPLNTKQFKATAIYHPLIPDCVANDLEVHQKSILLTGTNMSGKTTFIRTIGINILVAQTLHTAFAREFRFPAPIRIFSALMLSDNLGEGISSYLQEVRSIHEMLQESNHGGFNLFLMDEIFKGTNTRERIAVAKAVLQVMQQTNSLVFVSTHDTELADLLKEEYDLYHFCERLDEKQIHFDYKLKKGKLNTRNAIRILEISGYPEEIIRNAYETYQQLTPSAP
ncbi:MAG: hypothetical protein LUG98_06350 [Tannerellaceae bacterium]|nr:hypothetical protein [Tannerellaceae bacterium]